MGVDTKVRLKGRIEPEVIADYIDRRYGFKVKVDVRLVEENEIQSYVYKVLDDSEKDKFWFGNISFKDRWMIYSYSNVIYDDDLKYYSELGLHDMVLSETTYLSLGYNQEAVDILKDICTHFGGWIDENDSDDKTYYPVLKDDNGNQIPVIHVTRKELNEKFGGIVVIDD